MFAPLGLIAPAGPIPLGQLFIMFKIFDQARLLTTRNIKYLSASPGTELDPNGIWSVVATIQNELLLVKNNIVIRVPASDVLKIAEYQRNKILQKLGKLTTHGEKTSREKDSSQS